VRRVRESHISGQLTRIATEQAPKIGGLARQADTTHVIQLLPRLRTNASSGRS